METKAKLPKKLLSMFLAMLMIFSACYVGIDGAYTAYAAAEDSNYTADEVVALINAATAGGFNLSSSGNAWNYNADDGKVIAAAEAIFDYAVNTYRDGNDETAKGNSSKALCEYMERDIIPLCSNAASAKKLVENVLNPSGAVLYSYENPGTSYGYPGESSTAYEVGQNVTETFPIASYPAYYPTGVATGTTTKSVDISINLTEYLKTFDSIDDIPSTVITNVKYTYTHGFTSSATVSKVDTRTETVYKTDCDGNPTTDVDHYNYYYTPTITTSAYNYMGSKPNRKVTKDNTIRKTLLTIEKYFNAERLAMTQEEMLALPLEDINNLYSTTQVMYKMLNDELGNTKFTDAALDHFGLGSAAIHAFMNNVDFAYRVSAAKYNIDNLNSLIGTTYNEESYAEMSALYAKTSTAYNVVFNLKQDVITYLDTTEYAEKYDSAIALKATAESYNATLFDIMTEQKLEETVAAMVATYTKYINVLKKDDINTPTDAEVIDLKQEVEAFDSVIASYTGKSYYRNYWTVEYENEWNNNFKVKLQDVYEIRGLKADFQIDYKYFYPIIYTTKLDAMETDALIALHQDFDTKLQELKDTYTALCQDTNVGANIAAKIFTVTYGKDANGEPVEYLLQNLLDSVKGVGKNAAKDILIARTEAQLDAVYAYKDTTTVNFENFASIKSTLTYFDYDLYNYVVDNNLGLSQAYKDKYAQVQTLLDRYHAFSTSSGKSSYDDLKEDFGFADENGNFAVRPAGNQVDGEGNQIGYPNDIARDGAEDNYYVTEDKMLDTVERIDNFIVGRDFGALIGLTDAEDEETYVDLGTYVEQMLESMLYNDEMINTLVSAIFPMICDMIANELVGALGNMDGARVDDNGVPWLDLNALVGSSAVQGELGLYLDETHKAGNPEKHQKNFMEVFADIGLNIYPASLADSLMMSNPIDYGVESDIYKALKAAGKDWTQLVCEDDPETPLVDETKTLEFEWGVYDEDTFIEVMGCILDAILPLLQTALTDKQFTGTSSNALVAYSDNIKAIYIINANNTYIRGELTITIEPLNLWSTVITPLFDVLGVEKIPQVKSDDSGYDIADALVGTLLKRVDEILADPLASVLDILPNLVYFLSMDTVQEIINGLNINLHLALSDMDVYAGSGLGNTLLDWLKGTVMDFVKFDIPLKIADMLDLYDLLGFEISDFNEVLKFVVPMLGIEGLTLPEIKQHEIILCSDWVGAEGSYAPLQTNKGELMYWFLDYVVKALVPDENGNSLLTSLLGSDMDPTIKGILDKVVSQLTGNPKGALAAIIELLNPATNADGTPKYDLATMNWLESQYDYGDPEIAGATQMSIVYLNYGNDWTKDKAEALVDDLDGLVETVMEMVEADLGGAESIGAFLADKVNAIFTNENITKLVEMLGGFGDSPSAVINDVVKNQVGIDIGSWFTAFGYLYPAETWAEDAEIIPLGHRNYVNNFGVEGVANEDGTISWFFNRMPLNDGDGYTFVNILSRLIGPASLLIEFLFAGTDVSAFEDLLIIKGYETYDTSLGLLLEMLGVENLPTQADFNADAMGSFTNLLTAVLDWFYALTSSDTMIKDLIGLLPDLFYFIESNGLSVLLHNLLMPVWVLVDTVRPLLDVDINGVLSLVVSEFLNYGTLNIDTILQYVVHGIYQKDDLDFVWYNIDIDNITISEIIKLADLALGTNLYNSGLVQVGIKGFCSGLEKVENTAVGTVYKPTIDAADTITILVTALLDCLSYPAADESKTNGDAIFGLIAELTENEKIAGLYPVIAELIAGVEVTYTEPNWGYMLKGNDTFTTVSPKPTIAYLDYTATDWTEDKAKEVYASLDQILEMFLPDLLEEQGAEDLATLVEGILEDNVYTDEILNTIIETIVNLLAGLNQKLFETIDVVLDTNIASWFTYCKLDEETGKYVCIKDWGIADAEDKAAAFKNAIVEVLAPADNLLAFVFFGEDFDFFTGSEKNEATGEYVYNDIININGIEGYERTIVPILRALGIALPSAADLEYKTSKAVGAILDGVLGLVDRLSTESPVQVIFELLPNLIYFINADGLKSSVNNLLIPVNELLAKVNPLLKELNPEAQDISLDALLGDKLPEGLVLTELTTDTLLNLAAGFGIVLESEKVDYVELIKKFYVGKFEAYTYAETLTGYTLDVEGYEHDVLTIVLSLAIDLFNCNEELFAGLLGENGASIYAAIKRVIAGYEVTLNEINWAYMYEDIEDGATAIDQLKTNGFPAPEFAYLDYSTDWTEQTAADIYAALDEIINLVLPMVIKDGNLKTIVEGVLNDNVYSDAVLNSVIEMIVNAIADFQGAIGAVDALLDTDIASWFSMCIYNEETEKYEVSVDFGIDEAETTAEKGEKFIAAVGDVLEPANGLLAWLFFGESYTFFNSAETDENGNNKVLITLNGGRGYAYAIAPILEALGLEMKAESAYLKDGKYNTALAVEDILKAVLGLVNELDNYEYVVKFVFKLLPNLIYFINADGLKTSVNNLLAPVNDLFETISVFFPENMQGKDIGELINGLLPPDLGLDITNITMDALLALAGNYGVVFTNEEGTVDLTTVLKGLYVGEAKEFVGANGNAAFKVDIEGSEYDVLTVLLGFAIDLFKLNKDLFADLLDGAYDDIITLINGITVTYTEINWAYMYDGDFAKLDAQGFPSKTIEKLPYTKDWTEEAAQGVYAALDPLADMLLPELIENGSLLDFLMGILNDEVFTDKTANALIELIVNAIAGLDETIVTIIQAADSILGADVSVWFSMCTYNEETGKYECTEKWGIDGAADPKAEFIKAVKTVITPANDLLAWLFFADSYTFFDGETKTPLITINGGEGYANALVPLLEAIGCDMEAKEAFYNAETEKYDVGAAIESILDSVLDFAAEVSANPVEEVFNLLPNLIYFINAGGVKAVVNNLLAPVDAVLNSLKGLVGEISIGKLLYDAVGFDVSEITTATLLQIARDNGVEISKEMEDLVCELAVGTPKQYESATELKNPAYRVNIAGAEGEILTIVLALALDIFTTNKTLFADLLGGEAQYEAVIKIISGAASGVNWNYTEIDWGYMYAGDELADRLQALEAANGKLPNYPANSTAANYLLYGNNWNKDTAIYVNQVIDAVVAGIMEDTSLGQILDNAITNGLYQDSILNSLLESVVGLIVDYAEIIENAGALLGAESISKWFYDEETGEGYVKIVDGEAVCVHDFGIDEAKTNEEKRTLFVEAFVDVLEPAYRLLAWLLFGEDFEFLSGTTGAPLITLTGGQGYAKGFAPLLEALGATMPGVDGTYVNGKSGIKPASAYYDENGVLDMEAAVRDIFSALADWLYKICGDLGEVDVNDEDYLGTIGAMLELLPNVIYNINAGTLKAVVSNLLLPVEEILGHLEAFGLEVNFETLVEIGGQPLNIKDIDWYDIFDIVASLVNLYWPPEIEEFLATLYLGNAVAYDSASGETGYYMTYNPDDTDTNYLISGREDMITLLISFVVDGALDPRNEAQLTDWLGADIYKVIYKYLSKDITPVDMQKFDWKLTEYAGTGEVLSPVTLGAVINSEFYGTLYTREMGQYIEKWLPSFVDTMIVLLGVQAEDGTNFEGLEDILNDLIGTSLYTKANLQSILDAIKGLIPTLKDELPEGLFDVIVNVLKNALGIDLTYFDTYTIADFADGDREAFVNGLVNMFEPLAPILRWLLTGEDLIALFHVADGSDAVVIEGAEGYAYGIIPLLEAFDYEGNILTPEEFEANSDTTAAMLKNVLNPILDVVDKVLADPVNEIFNVLPGIIYFLNSNGLDTVIRNVLNAVLVVLKNIEPLTDGLAVEDIYEMIGFNAGEINIDTLLDELLKGLEEDTGFQLEDVAMEAIKELTLGEVISFTSKNGEQAYTMKYATGADRVDMVTVVLRTALTFISIPENVVALEGMLEGSLDEEGYKFVCSLLENFSQMAASDNGMDEIMYTVYQIFYAANVAAHSTEDWLAEFNGDYSFLNQLFATSDLAFLRQLEASLGDLLNKFTGDIIDDDEIVPNGFIAFFQKIAEFFKKIGEFFANLFK